MQSKQAHKRKETDLSNKKKIERRQKKERCPIAQQSRQRNGGTKDLNLDNKCTRVVEGYYLFFFMFISFSLKRKKQRFHLSGCLSVSQAWVRVAPFKSSSSSWEGRPNHQQQHRTLPLFYGSKQQALLFVQAWPVHFCWLSPTSR